MSAPFAALETKVNAAVIAHLANAVVDFGAGVTAEGVFDNRYAEAFEFASGSTPVVSCAAADLPAITLGATTCTINSVTYVIQESRPDGIGMVLLILSKQ